MAESLWYWDQSVLRFLNVTLAHPATDTFWGTITHLHKLPWFQFVFFPILIGVLLYIYGVQLLKPLVALALAVALADMISYRVIKASIQRQRPFDSVETSSWVRKVGEAHGTSFPSNHAANCFAGATVLAYYFRKRRYFFYTFATLVALSRPALGVHFPSDAIGGAILGIFVAWLIRLLLIQNISWFRMKESVPKTDTNSGDTRLRSRRLSRS